MTIIIHIQPVRDILKNIVILINELCASLRTKQKTNIMNNNLGYEIDFISVDSGKKNGDAITIRIKENEQTTIYVIDAGTKVTGQKVVDHIKEFYGTEKVDYLINTHPDLDHISGLTIVMEQLDVKQVWMHKPWEHAHEIIDDILDSRVTINSLTISCKTLPNIMIDRTELLTCNPIALNIKTLRNEIHRT
jgi:beta-lactamase superfamily II metal-dependent hydrolase